MIDISIEEQDKYPNPDGGNYTRKYDIKNQTIRNSSTLSISNSLNRFEIFDDEMDIMHYDM